MARQGRTGYIGCIDLVGFYYPMIPPSLSLCLLYVVARSLVHAVKISLIFPNIPHNPIASSPCPVETSRYSALPPTTPTTKVKITYAI